MASAIIQMATASGGRKIIPLDKVENKPRKRSVSIMRCGEELFLLSKEFGKWVNFVAFKGSILDAHNKAETMIF